MNEFSARGPDVPFDTCVSADANDLGRPVSSAAVPTLERLNTEALRETVRTFRDTVRAHAGWLNRLNVYPVPDGDTGTNMARTLDGWRRATLFAAVALEHAKAGRADAARRVVRIATSLA